MLQESGSALRETNNEEITRRGKTLERRKKQPKVNVVGISGGYHDSACCLLQNGVLTAAVQEERFSRVKNDKSLPGLAFRYCLEQAGLTISDLDCVGYYEDPRLKLGRQIWMGMLPNLSAERMEATRRRLVAQRPEKQIRESLGYSGDIQIVEHHLSHAASA